jgi:hypothetical protein
VITRRDLVIVVIAAFLFGSTAGLLGGMVGARLLMSFGVEMANNRRPGGGFGRMRREDHDGPPPTPMVVERLSRALDLTPAQRESIAAVLDHSRARFAAQRDSLERQIERQLTPAQREQWRMMHEHPFVPGGPHPGPPGGPFGGGPEPGGPGPDHP